MICKNNPHHRYGSHLPTCPWCEREAQYGGAPSSHSQPAPAAQVPTRIPIRRAPASGANTPPAAPQKQTVNLLNGFYWTLREDSVHNDVFITYFATFVSVGVFYIILSHFYDNKSGIYIGLIFGAAASLISEFTCSMNLIFSSIKEIVVGLFLGLSNAALIDFMFWLNATHSDAFILFAFVIFLIWILYPMWVVDFIARSKWSRIEKARI